MLLLIPTGKSGAASILRKKNNITLQMDELQYLGSDVGHGSSSPMQEVSHNRDAQVSTRAGGIRQTGDNKAAIPH